MAAKCGASVQEPKYEQPELQRFYDYWKSKWRDCRLPGRDQIDPLDIPDLLPGLLLVDVVRQGKLLRFRVRLTGTGYNEINRRDMTGEWIDEAFEPKVAREIVKNYERVVHTGQPHFWRSHLHMEGRRHIPYWRLICPLAADGETVDMLIGMFTFDKEADRRRPNPWLVKPVSRTP